MWDPDGEYHRRRRKSLHPHMRPPSLSPNPTQTPPISRLCAGLQGGEEGAGPVGFWTPPARSADHSSTAVKNPVIGTDLERGRSPTNLPPGQPRPGAWAAWAPVCLRLGVTPWLRPCGLVLHRSEPGLRCHSEQVGTGAAPRDSGAQGQSQDQERAWAQPCALGF